jgi:diguanylate cyclase (GGDEF)-like protein
MKILVAEDDQNSRQLLLDILESADYQVVAFEDGVQALRFLEQEPDAVDMIISDILMPEADGYSLCRAVKQNISLQKIPFIFYTATYTSDKDKRFALSLGASAFLIKPMEANHLLQEIELVINQSNLPQAKPKNRGLLRSSPMKLDKQHADIVRNKLDKKILELDEERRKLLESEQRFKDFAEASAEWFWESDPGLNLIVDESTPKAFNFTNLEDFAESCNSHSSNEVLKLIQNKEKLADLVVYADQDGKQVFMRVSGKPIFDTTGEFIGYRGAGRDVSETIALNQQVEYLATHDELTGLPNRNLFRQRLEHAIAKSERTGKHILVLFFDLDYFKMVNDTLGHDAGDKLLIQAVERISTNARSSDILCRVGGDEFVMIMEGASPQDGNRFVRDIIAAFEPPFDIHNQRVYCTVSIGVSVYPDDTQDPESLLLYADLAMYRAKQNGRNSFEFYTASMNFIAHQWSAIEQGLRHALKDDELFMLYQPQIDYETKAIVGLEALIRWRHPERGIIPPAEFIKVAEQSSLINQIGEFVIEHTCAQIRSWIDAGYDVPRLSVNISPRHFRSNALSESLSNAVEKYALPPSLICIEITEHALLDEVDAVRHNMQYIKQRGFHICLDDFGMGHSSLLYIKRLNVDEIKIDQSFINGLGSSEEDHQIVKAIVALSEALGLRLIGEGVESDKQVDILAESGCQLMQGYYYSLPLSVDELEKQLTKANRKKPKKVTS